MDFYHILIATSLNYDISCTPKPFLTMMMMIDNEGDRGAREEASKCVWLRAVANYTQKVILSMSQC